MKRFVIPLIICIIIILIMIYYFSTTQNLLKNKVQFFKIRGFSHTFLKFSSRLDIKEFPAINEVLFNYSDSFQLVKLEANNAPNMPSWGKLEEIYILQNKDEKFLSVLVNNDKTVFLDWFVRGVTDPVIAVKNTLNNKWLLYDPKFEFVLTFNQFKQVNVQDIKQTDQEYFWEFYSQSDQKMEFPFLNHVKEIIKPITNGASFATTLLI